MRRILLSSLIFFFIAAGVSTAKWLTDPGKILDKEYGPMLKLDKPVKEMTPQEMIVKCKAFRAEAISLGKDIPRSAIKQLDIILARLDNDIALNNQILDEINRRLVIVKKKYYAAKAKQLHDLGLQ